MRNRWAGDSFHVDFLKYISALHRPIKLGVPRNLLACCYFVKNARIDALIGHKRQNFVSVTKLATNPNTVRLLVGANPLALFPARFNAFVRTL
jgi:hypothetical protein